MTGPRRPPLAPTSRDRETPDRFPGAATQGTTGGGNGDAGPELAVHMFPQAGTSGVSMVCVWGTQLRLANWATGGDRLATEQQRGVAPRGACIFRDVRVPARAPV